MINSQIHKLQALSLQSALPHAWIFTSPDNNNAHQLASEFSQWLLCSKKLAQTACGQCRECNLFLANAHPDFWRLVPKDDKSVISIDSVREVNEFCHGKPQLSQHKIVLLYPAKALNKQSANALLKTLEEPRGNTIFILISNHVDLVPKTIVSRCHLLNLSLPFVINDANRRIIGQMAQDLTSLWIEKSVTCSQIVEAWIKLWPQELLYCLEIVLTDIIRFKYTGNISSSHAWHAQEKQLSKVHSGSKFWTILERLREAQYCFGQNHKPNLQLVLEHMLLV